APGRVGVGETSETAFRVPAVSLGFWTHRFVAEGVRHEAPETRFGETVIPFRDPDGMRLALVAVPGAEAEAGWSGGDVPSEHAIRGFHGVTLMLDKAEPTAAILTDVLGFAETAREGSIIRLKAGDTPIGGVVDLRAVGGFLPGRPGGGSVHHVAFRASDDAAQAEMVRKLSQNHGVRATEQKDRDYFRSVYFREPGGVLFEIATDSPGFAVDEAPESLGQTLKLPKFLEPHRERIEATLPDISPE
ncbi:MAG TPA: ring-cleaving dioxygenase, partial [Hansschlegelia sp.]